MKSDMGTERARERSNQCAYKFWYNNVSVSLNEKSLEGKRNYSNEMTITIIMIFIINNEAFYCILTLTSSNR